MPGNYKKCWISCNKSTKKDLPSLERVIGHIVIGVRNLQLMPGRQHILRPKHEKEEIGSENVDLTENVIMNMGKLKYGKIERVDKPYAWKLLQIP